MKQFIERKVQRDGIGSLNPSLIRAPLCAYNRKTFAHSKDNSFHLFQEKLEEKNSGQDLVQQL